MRRYDSYKDSGVEWLGEVPSHWHMKKLKYILVFSTGGTPSTHKDDLYDGDEPWVTIADISGRFISATHFISKQGIKAARIPLTPKGSLLYSFKLSVGQVAFANQDLYTNEAIASFFPQDGVNLNFWYYALPMFVIKNANTNIYGAYLLNQDLIKNALLVVPPPEEQDRIVAFLDEKTAEIDAAIAKKERLIELLKEQKNILINRAVTRGLNPDVPMRDSGVEWIGEVPAHWQVKRAKYLFREIDVRSVNGDEELLSVSHMTGVTPRSEKNISMFMAEDYSGSKLCHKSDLVFNIMWAWMGALGVSDRTGIVSSSYGVYRQKLKGIFTDWYLEHLLRSVEYVAEYNRRSTGLHSSRLRLYPDMFLDMELSIPPIDEQKTIESITTDSISNLEIVIGTAENEIRALNEFRTILIAQTVTGRLKT